MYATKHSTLSFLPPDWSVTEVIDETIVIDGLELRRAGISAESREGAVVTGSAADVEEALQRAEFELLERASLLDASIDQRSRVVRRIDGSAIGFVAHDDLFLTSDEPERWQPSRSNGVAIGSDWASACRSAMLELVERDRLLRSWCGEGVPARVGFEHTSLSRVSSYDWQTFRFPMEGAWSDPFEVAMVVGFPRRAGTPLVRGSAAADSLEVAIARAARECLQGLAFLWGEEVPIEPPLPSPTPLFHLERYLWRGAQAQLRGWLAGSQTRMEGSRLRDDAEASLQWVDLTPPALRGRFCVAQARCAAAVPLFFGEGPAWWRKALPPSMWVHPIA
jgi:hypothetical protein